MDFIALIKQKHGAHFAPQAQISITQPNPTDLRKRVRDFIYR
jgi:hypothetical protein